MTKLRVYNKTTNKEIIYETQAKIDLNNTHIVIALLKSLSGVHKTDFDSVSYI